MTAHEREHQWTMARLEATPVDDGLSCATEDCPNERSMHSENRMCEHCELADAIEWLETMMRNHPDSVEDARENVEEWSRRAGLYTMPARYEERRAA